MLPSPQGSYRLFTLFGITAYLHWTWVIAAIIFLQISKQEPILFLAEYVGLFLIVLTHEFGHALACRSVGGKSENIVLFPLGGVAYVNPPPRPGAVLWSVAAGPLVNVILVPVFMLAWLQWGGPMDLPPENLLQSVIRHLAVVNGVLLVFNMLPIYPLDGGQIVQSILWFFVGYRKSLQFVATIGMVAGIVMVGLGIWSGQFMIIVMAIFIFMQALKGYGHAKLLAMSEQFEQNMQHMNSRMQDMFNQGGFGQQQTPPPSSSKPAPTADDDEVFDPKKYEKKHYMDDQ
jgi:Zn-dependent protease